MEKIYYDSYEKRIRTTVWAEKISDGSVKIHKYVRGIYVDDIGGLDETDTVLTVHEESLQKLFSEAHVPSVKDLFVFFTQFACCREGYEHIRSWIDEVPMIVTAVGGLTETIGERGTGIVAEEVSPEAIRREIENYFSDDCVRKYCVEHIRKEKERLSWAKFADDLLDFAGTL